MKRDELDARLLAAHGAGDTGALARLYARAAEEEAGLGRLDSACFYWTHAYVFALVKGDQIAGEIREKLRAHGREE